MTHRYRAYHQEIKNRFGERIDRITVNAGMTCPNIDGTKARGGSFLWKNMLSSVSIF